MARGDSKHDDSKTPVGFFVQYWRQLMRYLMTGLLVWVPLLITLWVTWFFVEKFVFGIDNLARSAIRYINVKGTEWGMPEPVAMLFEPFQGMGILIAILIFLTTGFLTRFLVGQKIIAIGERIVDRIPLISRVYRAVQQIRDVFIGRKGAVFQQVVVVEYPRQGMLSVGFLTSREQGDVQQTLNRDLHAVFIPTTPNPTSGYLLYLPPEDITIMDISVEEAMKLIISGGAYIPAKRGLASDVQAAKEAAEAQAKNAATSSNPDDLSASA